MNKSGYTSPKPELWSGRVDSHTEESGFRWHQVVHCENIQNISENEEVALLGFACDVGVARNNGRIGAAKGPDHFRETVGNLCWHGQTKGFLDVGTIKPNEENLELGQKVLGESIHQLLKHQKLPCVIGGGHETAFGHYLGIASFLKNSAPAAKLGILNIDAHFDLRPYDQGAHSGSPFLQALDDAEQNELDVAYFVHGINPHNNTRSLFETSEKRNVGFNTNDEVIRGNKSAKKKLQRFLDSRTHIYLTICLDVFAASIAPGVSAPAWNGIQLQHALEVIKLVKSYNKLLSMDICELNPKYDVQNLTAKTAGILFAELVQGS